MSDDEVKLHEEKLVQRIMKAKGPKKEEFIRAMMESMKDTVHKMVIVQFGLVLSIILNITLILILIVD